MSDDKLYRVMRSYNGVDDCLGAWYDEAEAREYAKQMGNQSPFLIWVDGPKDNPVRWIARGTDSHYPQDRNEIAGLRVSLDAETRRADDNDDARKRAVAERDRYRAALADARHIAATGRWDCDPVRCYGDQIVATIVDVITDALDGSDDE